VNELRIALDQLQQRPPFMLELQAENGFTLTVGIGGPVSCIQYASTEGEPPYFVAMEKSAHLKRKPVIHAFLCGNQNAEISDARCVPFTILRSVAAYFIETGARSPEVDWVEV